MNFLADYRDHAQEANLPLPDKITLFHKPRTSLTGPWPAEVLIPQCVHQEAEQSDYESELCVIIGKDCRNVSEEQALDYVLGYTAANDISARKAQFETSQWSRSKGFDAACPIGERANILNDGTNTDSLASRTLQAHVSSRLHASRTAIQLQTTIPCA